MINYELAKQLKDAGFPQQRIEYNCEYCESAFGPKKQDEVYIPTLSELIQKCDKLCGDLVIFSHSDGWRCGDYLPYEHNWVVIREDKDLDVAVAKLWLELNKKVV